jgi:hypothetical protein
VTCLPVSVAYAYFLGKDVVTDFEVFEPRHDLSHAFTVFGVILADSAHGRGEDFCFTVWASTGEDLLEVPGIVGSNDGFGGVLLGGEVGHG